MLGPGTRVGPEVEARRRRGPGTANTVLPTSGWLRCCRARGRMAGEHQSSLPGGGGAWLHEEPRDPARHKLHPGLPTTFYVSAILGPTWVVWDDIYPGVVDPSCKYRSLGTSFWGWGLSNLAKPIICRMGDIRPTPQATRG